MPGRGRMLASLAGVEGFEAGKSLMIRPQAYNENENS